jgi:hypothetical protein
LKGKNIGNNAMVITNVEKLTGLKFCRKSELDFRILDHHTERFNKHCEQYNDKFHKKLKLKPSLAFLPQIMKNEAVQFILIKYGNLAVKILYYLVSSYIINEFETLNDTYISNNGTKAFVPQIMEINYILWKYIITLWK